MTLLVLSHNVSVFIVIKLEHHVINPLIRVTGFQNSNGASSFAFLAFWASAIAPSSSMARNVGQSPQYSLATPARLWMNQMAPCQSVCRDSAQCSMYTNFAHEMPQCPRCLLCCAFWFPPLSMPLFVHRHTHITARAASFKLCGDHTALTYHNSPPPLWLHHLLLVHVVCI